MSLSQQAVRTFDFYRGTVVHVNWASAGIMFALVFVLVFLRAKKR